MDSSGTSYGGGGAFGGVMSGLEGAMEHANNNAGSSGDSSMFSQALSMVSGNQNQLAQQPVDENHLVDSHQSFFGGGDAPSNPSSSSMGSAAAMQALKMFTGGSGGSGGSSQNAFVGMAMGEASKLFDSQNAQGNTGNADKQSVVNHAAETAMKMYMQSEMGGGGGGGGLMSLAGKFM